MLHEANPIVWSILFHSGNTKYVVNVTKKYNIYFRYDVIELKHLVLEVS